MDYNMIEPNSGSESASESGSESSSESGSESNYNSSSESDSDSNDKTERQRIDDDGNYIGPAIELKKTNNIDAEVLKSVEKHKDSICTLGGNECLPKEEKSKLAQILHVPEKTAIPKAIEKTQCADELCAVKKILNAKTFAEVEQYYKEYGPLKRNEWLSNFDIDDYLDKLVAISDFDFANLGFQMIDFDEKDTELNQLTAEILVKHPNNHIGCVVNTDRSNGNGEHWFAMFIDKEDFARDHKKPISIEYFNSTGDMPMTSINLWMRGIKLDLKKMKYNAKITLVRKIAHQTDDGECGVYALFYIIKRLEGKPPSYFMDHLITDKEMTLFRMALFR